MVPYINRGGAVLWVLEGAGSAPFEQWCWDVAKTNGLSQSVYVITNSNLPGAVKSPHVKSVASVKSGAHAGYYGSSDGWQGDSPRSHTAEGCTIPRHCMPLFRESRRMKMA